MKLRALKSASLLLTLLAPVPARAEVRRALLVGINDYSSIAQQPGYVLSEQTLLRLRAVRGRPSRKTLDKLDGAVNDAEAMKEMLIQRFGFDEDNVIVLLNRQATADSILRLLQVHLIDKAKPGDVSLFYFAGHGSRIRNLAPKKDNPSGLDSTLIPADALLGVPDIRSKELSRIYSEAPKKGVMLTVIQDSCYSGAASRGAVAVRKMRSQPLDPAVSVDESLSGPLPEDSGVLVMTASQEYEPAAELVDTDLNGAHGAFTWALLRALGASPINERADRIFQRARALMQSKAPMQEPVLLAKKGRNARGLFGQPSDSGQMITVAVGRVMGSVIKLNGGLAMSLHEGCELKRVAHGKSAVNIRITKVNGLSSSDAVFIQPDDGERVQPGDLFALEKWVAPDGALLHVYVGKGPLRADLDRDIGALAELRKLMPVDWVEDPTVHAPTHRLSWDSSTSKWTLTDLATSSAPILIQSLTPNAFERLLPRNARARLFVQIPPAAEMVAALRLENVAADTADSPGKADYVLLGRLCATPGTAAAEYSWAVPDLSEDALPKDRFSALPLRTDWFAGTAADAPAEPLRNALVGLTRVAGWLSLTPPASDNAWPYELVLQNAKTQQILSGQEVRGGEQYKLMLRAMPGASLKAVSPRRVYVFVIDSFGRGTLVFGENLENEFPRIGDDSAELIPLTDVTITISEPYGLDHYFLLASATPIDNPETVFSFSDVRTRGAQPADPLSRLLVHTGTATRGTVTNVPLNWSIERLTLRSRPVK